MGQKHNRRRTRGRPRNRNSAFRSRTFSSYDSDSFVRSLASPQPFLSRSNTTDPLPSPFAAPPSSHWHAQYAAWQERAELQRQAEQEWEQWHQQRRERERKREAELEAQRIRFFGGEVGDEASLCGPMLQVVMDLFNGIDYEDP